MKEYQAPFIELIRFEAEEILSISNPENNFDGDSDNVTGDDGFVKPF